MSLSRRKFLRAGTMVAISAGISMKTLAATALSQPRSLFATNDLDPALNLSREIFSRHLNTKFSFARGEAEAVAVKLIEVNDLAPKRSRRATASGKECFAAVFIGSQNTPMPQETYTVTHESLGKFAMFIVPISTDRKGVYYEAVFNRLH